MTSDKSSNLPKLIGIKEAAEMLSVHPATLRRWDKKGILKAVRIGERRNVGDRRYPLEGLKKIINKNG